MNDDKALDSALREKLCAIADGELPEPASEAVQTELVERLVREQQLLTRRRRRSRWGVMSAALAAAAAFAVVRLQDEPEHYTSKNPPACALPSHVQLQTQGAPQVALGRLGTLVASDDARLSIQSAEACLLRIRLERGTLAGDLNNLRPAELRIETPFAEVVVRGTRFSIAADQALEVVLLSGIVDVERGTSKLRLAPRQVLRQTHGDLSVSAVNQAQREHVESLLRRIHAGEPRESTQTTSAESSSAESKVPAAAKSPAELLFLAEQERKNGALTRARRLYAEASSFKDENAEVALLRWVRLELRDGKTARAAELLTLHQKRFKTAKLGAEAAWLEIEGLSMSGQTDRAKQRAQQLMARYPRTPQAEAAQALLSKQ